MAIPAVVEGYLESVFLPVVLRQIGRPDIEPNIRDAGGITKFWPIAQRYNNAAVHMDMIGLADLEQHDCAPQVIANRIPTKRPRFHLRLAVRMLESWLIADREMIAAYLQVPVAAVPQGPDGLIHAKMDLVNVARHSRSRAVRDAMLPGDSGGVVGPDYVAKMVIFIGQHWRAAAARAASPSLDRACVRWHAIEPIP
jgi:hypothetical protein